MDKSEIVRLFITKGYQLSGDALSLFESSPEKIGPFLEKKYDKPFVTAEVVNKTLSTDTRPTLISNFKSDRTGMSVSDMNNMLLHKYAKISDIFVKKPGMENLISVNKISEESRKFSVIVMLREVDEANRTLLVEDPTGSATMYLSDEVVGEMKYLIEDEVVCLVCDNEESSENKVTKILFPDIPMQTSIKSTPEDVYCVFLSHLTELSPAQTEKLTKTIGNMVGKKIIFVIDGADMSIEGAEKVVMGRDFPDPSIIDVGGVRILVVGSQVIQRQLDRLSVSLENAMVALAKKRDMSPGVGPLDMSIDQVPDIFVSGPGLPGSMNYKGSTFISIGDPSRPVFWCVNLKTRENIKIDLS